MATSVFSARRFARRLRHVRLIWIGCFIGGVAGVGLAFAGMSSAETLAQVFTLAQQHNPALRSAQANYQAALSGVPLARSKLLPQLVASANLSANAQDNSDNPLLQKFGMPTQ